MWGPTHSDVKLNFSGSVVSDISEKDSGRYRRTPHGSPRLGRDSSSRLRRTSPRPSKTSFGRTSDGGEGRGVHSDVVGRHLYSNFDTEELRFGQRFHTGGGVGGQVAQPVGLPTLLMPQDYRELRYAQLQLSTPSTPASGSHTPSSCPLTPSSNPQTPFLHPHTLWPSPTTPGLQRVMSPLALTSPGSSPTFINASQTSVKSHSLSPKLLRAFYSNLQSLSSLQTASALVLSPTPLKVGFRPPASIPREGSTTGETPKQFTGERGMPLSTSSAPATPHGGQQPHRDVLKPTINSQSTRDPPGLALDPAISPGDPPLPCNSPTSSSRTPPASNPSKAEDPHTTSSPTVSQDSWQQDSGGFPASSLGRLQKDSPATPPPRSRSSALRKKAASLGQMQKDLSPPGMFELL